MILIIKHVDVEGAGTLETYFDRRGYELQTVNFEAGDVLPYDLSNVEAVVAMGGPMNVYEEEKYPFLKEENILFKRVLKENIPFLGICLGSQLISKACGAQVIKSPVKEVGWFKARLDEGGKKDPLFQNVPEEFDVYHWHEDMFEIPKDGLRIATGDGCPNQALRIGRKAYGLQFHVEVTEKIISDWCQNYLKSGDPELVQKAKDMIQTYKKKRKDFNKTAEIIYANFERIMKEK